MKTITVTHLARKPGNYEVTGPGGLGGRKLCVECGDAGDAAAKAVQWALRVAGDYVILGSEKVLAHIPAELRMRRG